MSSPRDQAAFLSLIVSPERVPRRRLIDAVVQAAGPEGRLDPHTLGLRLAMAPPVILSLTDAAAGARAAAAIGDLGGDAFAPTVVQLESFGETMKVRDLRISGTDFEMDLWRGPSTRIPRDRVFVLVRAQLSGTIVHRESRGPTATLMTRRMGAVSNFGWSMQEDLVRKTTKTSTSDKLDLHTVDGMIFQLDGDKFGYGLLGDLRGHSDKANMDSMFELVQHLCEHAIADNFFPLFRPPGSANLVRIPNARMNNDDPAFAFYSRWVGLMYRHIAGAAA